MMFVFELTLVPLLLTKIQDQFALTKEQLAWFFNSYGVSVAIGVALGGWFGDRLQVQRVFLVGVLAFAIGSLLVALLDNFEGVILARIVQGLGGGIFSPLVPVLLTRTTPNQPGKTLIVWGSITGLLAAFAPFVFSLGLAEAEFRIAFVFFTVVAMFGLGLFLYGFDKVPEHASQPSEFSLSALLSARRLWLVYVYIFGTYGAFTYFIFALPLRLEANGMSFQTIALIFTAMWLSFSGVSTVLRNLVDGSRLPLVIAGGPILIVGGYIVANISADAWVLAVSAITIGAGLACSNAPSTQLILRFAPSGHGAIAASLDITFARLGGALFVGLCASYSFFSATIVATCLLIAALLSAQTALSGKDQKVAP